MWSGKRLFSPAQECMREKNVFELKWVNMIMSRYAICCSIKTCFLAVCNVGHFETRFLLFLLRQRIILIIGRGLG